MVSGYLAAIAFAFFFGWIIFSLLAHRRAQKELKEKVRRYEDEFKTEILRLYQALTRTANPPNPKFLKALEEEVQKLNFQDWTHINYAEEIKLPVARIRVMGGKSFIETAEENLVVVDVVRQLWDLLMWRMIRSHPETRVAAWKSERFDPWLPVSDRVSRILSHDDYWTLYREVNTLVWESFPELMKKMEEYRRLRLFEY